MPGTSYAAAVVETIRQPLLVLDGDFRVASANPAFYRHFEAKPGDTVGSRLWDLHDRRWDIPALRDLLARALTDDEVVEDFEVRHAFEGLGPRTFLVTARRVELEEDLSPLILVVFEEVTERRRAEQALAFHTRQLERSNRDLEEFAHAASHDLQEPLRKVRTFTDRLVGSLDPGALDERQRTYVDRIQDAASRMQMRIDDLLALARVSRVVPEHRTVELSEVLERVLRDLDGRIAESRASIEIADPLPALQADAPLLDLLFQNLLSNALKYGKQGVPPSIRISAEPARGPEGDEGPWLRIVVSDRGIGFEQQYAERVFRPFERLHGRGEYEGSGVGLSVCRRVVEQHGGTISAIAEPGEGAAFEVLLPTTQRDLEP